MARGADKVIEALDRFGVEYVFGHPGGAAMPIFDALLNSEQIRFVLTRHEQGREPTWPTGTPAPPASPGVVLVTSGPGATNTITGLLTALMDSSPVIALTGQNRHLHARQRRLSGGRCFRHLHAGGQTFLFGQRPQ